MPTGPLHVLLADDEPADREVATVILTGLGHQVTACASGREALAACLDNKQRFDLILLDVVMPNGDGVETARELRACAETQDVPIIFLSGMSGAGEVRSLTAVGFDGYLRKPYRRKGLIEIISRVLQARGRLAPGEPLG